MLTKIVQTSGVSRLGIQFPNKKCFGCNLQLEKRIESPGQYFPINLQNIQVLSFQVWNHSFVKSLISKRSKIRLDKWKHLKMCLACTLNGILGMYGTYIDNTSKFRTPKRVFYLLWKLIQLDKRISSTQYIFKVGVI